MLMVPVEVAKNSLKYKNPDSPGFLYLYLKL